MLGCQVIYPQTIPAMLQQSWRPQLRLRVSGAGAEKESRWKQFPLSRTGSRQIPKWPVMSVAPSALLASCCPVSGHPGPPALLKNSTPASGSQPCPEDLSRTSACAHLQREFIGLRCRLGFTCF